MALVEIAHDWQVSPSVLRGRQIVRRYYDADDNYTGCSVEDPRFTEDDLTEVLARATIKADTCPDCGERLSRSTHPEMSGWYEPQYRGECQKCATIEAWRADHKDEPNANRWAFPEVEGAPDQAELDANPVDWSTVTPPAPRLQAATDTLAGPLDEGDAIDAAFRDDAPTPDVLDT